MNEPKRRGRPPKMIALPVVDARPSFTIEKPNEVLFFVSEEARDACLRAQAYADRVWAGQSDIVPRAEKIERVKRALAGQNLPFEGVVLP